ncbi:MAG: hypothetical protein JWL77_4971, partial [Chthonomonadaceae bacterium]|nr:hypothetical protein [Chthonomonadaceae bacterium]
MRLSGKCRLQRRSSSTTEGYSLSVKADVRQPIAAECHLCVFRSSPWKGYLRRQRRGKTPSRKLPAFTRESLTSQTERFEALVLGTRCRKVSERFCTGSLEPCGLRFYALMGALARIEWRRGIADRIEITDPFAPPGSGPSAGVPQCRSRHPQWRSSRQSRLSSGWRRWCRSRLLRCRPHRG